MTLCPQCVSYIPADRRKDIPLVPCAYHAHQAAPTVKEVTAFVLHLPTIHDRQLSAMIEEWSPVGDRDVFLLLANAERIRRLKGIRP